MNIFEKSVQKEIIKSRAKANEMEIKKKDMKKC